MQRSFSVPGGVHIPHDRVWNTSEVKTFNGPLIVSLFMVS